MISCISRIIVLLMLIAIAGCATVQTPQLGEMLSGKMFSLKDGTEMEFKIQLSTGKGTMTAFNPVTNESYTGLYTGIFTGGASSKGVVRDSWGWESGTVETTSNPTGAIARGILKGDKGTVIDVYLDIAPGYGNELPTGHGNGTDNHDVHYQIQF